MIPLTIGESTTYAVARSSIRAYPHDYLATLGKNIERLRVKAGHKNAAAFARAIGVTPTTLNDWESGRYKNLRLDSLISIARGIPCAVEDLLVGVDSDYDVVIRQLSATRQNKFDVVTFPVREVGAECPDDPDASQTLTGANHVPPAHRLTPSDHVLLASLEAETARLEQIIALAYRIIGLASDTDRIDRTPPASRPHTPPSDRTDPALRDPPTGTGTGNGKRRRGGRS